MAPNFSIGPPHTGSALRCAALRRDTLDAKSQPTYMFISWHMSISRTMMLGTWGKNETTYIHQTCIAFISIHRPLQNCFHFLSMSIRSKVMTVLRLIKSRIFVNISKCNSVSIIMIMCDRFNNSSLICQ